MGIFKKVAIKTGLLAINVFMLGSGGLANAQNPNFQMTLTNAGDMPVSPPIFWIARDRAGVPELGSNSTQGHRNVCESGNSDLLKQELQNNRKVRYVHTASAPILPGQSLVLNIPKMDLRREGLYVTFMYGKTKNICGGIFDVDLPGFGAYRGKDIQGRDTVFLSGAYGLPMISLNENCNGAASAVACLRSFAKALSGPSSNMVKAFTGYLPRTVNKIEKVFGSEEAQSLIIPTGGAIQYTIKRDR